MPYESRQVWELGNGIPREEDGDEDGGATGRRRVAQLAAWSGGVSGAGTSCGLGTFGSGSALEELRRNRPPSWCSARVAPVRRRAPGPVGGNPPPFRPR